MNAMKIIMIFAIMCFCSKALIAQPAEHVVRTTNECWTSECMDEMACGEITVRMVITGNTYVIVADGRLIGERTGLEYTFKMINHDRFNLNENNDGFVRGKSQIFLVRSDGKLLAKNHYLNFVIFNANGDMTAAKQDIYIIECK